MVRGEGIEPSSVDYKSTALTIVLTAHFTIIYFTKKQLEELTKNLRSTSAFRPIFGQAGNKSEQTVASRQLFVPI